MASQRRAVSSDVRDESKAHAPGSRTAIEAPHDPQGPPGTILDMQRLAGNRATAGVIEGRSPSIPEAAAEAAGPDRLPPTLRAGIERLSGLELSEVRVHRNSPKPAQLDALSYTGGGVIELGPGQDDRLGHEAWHVVQQLQGRVTPTHRAKGAHVNHDPDLEREADHMAERLAQAQSGDTRAASPARSVASAVRPGMASVVQLDCKFCKEAGFDADHKKEEPGVCPFAAEPEPDEGSSEEVVPIPKQKAVTSTGMMGAPINAGPAPTGRYKNTTGHHDPTLAKWRKKSVKKNYQGKLGKK